MDQKIAVLGTGANGSCTSADLINNGFDVTMIDQWPAHVEVMQANGLAYFARRRGIACSRPRPSSLRSGDAQ